MAATQTGPPLPPPLPPGRFVDVAGRGDLFVRELGSSRPGQPTILLLHGWTLSSDLNWFALYDALARHGRVLAMDVRGHGRGLRSERRFSLEDAADDAAALLDHMGGRPAVVVGYSMGGSIALLLARRHPSAVAGLVLQSTALQWRSALHERVLWSSMPVVEHALRHGVARGLAGRYLRVAAGVNPDLAPVLAWLTAEAALSSPRGVAGAGRGLGAFDARSYAPRIAVPTVVVVSRLDRLLRPERQRQLADAIPGAKTIELEVGHNGWLVNPGIVGAGLEAALDEVVARVRQ